MLLPSYKQLAGLLDGAADGSDGKESARNAGDLGSIHGSGSSSGEGNGYPLQYSCLENPMDRGAWQAISPWGRKEMDMTKQLTPPPHTHTQGFWELFSSWVKVPWQEGFSPCALSKVNVAGDSWN